MFHNDEHKRELAVALFLAGEKAQRGAAKRMPKDAFRQLCIDQRDRLNRLHSRCAQSGGKKGMALRIASVKRFERFWLTAFRRIPSLGAA